MNPKLLLTLFGFLLFNFTTAQTKLIAHKSHSGSTENFKKSLTDDLFTIGNSNFGVAPVRIVRNAELDSVIFISNSMAVMITSNHCEDTYTDSTTLWAPGRDTVYHHPLFSKQHSLDSIKMILGSQYFFNNPPESIVFIGYDNGANEQNQQNRNFVIPFLPPDIPPLGPWLLLLVSLYAIRVLKYKTRLLELNQ